MQIKCNNCEEYFEHASGMRRYCKKCKIDDILENLERAAEMKRKSLTEGEDENGNDKKQIIKPKRLIKSDEDNNNIPSTKPVSIKVKRQLKTQKLREIRLTRQKMNLMIEELNKVDEFGKLIDYHALKRHSLMSHLGHPYYDVCGYCKRYYDFKFGNTRCNYCSIYGFERTKLREDVLINCLLQKINNKSNEINNNYTIESAYKEFIPQLTLNHPDDDFPYVACYRKYYTRPRQFIRIYIVAKYFDVDCLLTKLPIELIFYIANIMYYVIHQKLCSTVPNKISPSLILDGICEYDYYRYIRDKL